MSDSAVRLRALLAILLSALLLVAACLPGQLLAQPRIGLVTMEPGEPYWARFGHNAIVVDPADGSQPTLYNYGYFDFDEPGFLFNFLRGRMHYRLVALPMAQDLAYYAEEGRGVTVQWLAIEGADAVDLAAFLAWNAQPENAVYRYDYFTDNCSTRVRDALDQALDGALRAQLSGRSQGITYRHEALRLGQPLPWMHFGMHLGLGPFADRPLSRWDEAFVPMRLRDSLREVRLADGRPLVLSEEILLPHRLVPPQPEAPQWRARYALLGLALAIAALWLGSRRPRLLARLSLGLWLLCGLAGLGLLALWGLTTHVAAHGNENLLLFSPLALLLLPGTLALARGRAPSHRYPWWLRLVLASAALALFLKFLPFRIQANGDWIALMLPLLAALTLRLGGQARQAARTD